MNNKITGVILAGGENSRMGTDKGLLPVDGENIVERIIAAMKSSVQEIIIITNGNNYDYLGYKVYNDLIKNCGPMGGIYTGLSFSKTDKNFVVSCDMPFVSKELVQFMVEGASNCQIAIPLHNGKVNILNGQESNNIGAFALADCIIYLIAEKENVKSGDTVEVHLLP